MHVKLTNFPRKPSTLYFYSLHTGALLSSFPDYRMPLCASFNHPIAPHNALWFLRDDEKDVTYIDLDQPPPLAVRPLSFPGYKCIEFEVNVVHMGRIDDKDNRDVLFYSPCLGYGARARLPCAHHVKDLVAHSNAFFYMIEQQLCAVILDAAPHPAPLTEASVEAVFPFVETRVLATGCSGFSLIKLQNSRFTSNHGPLLVRMGVNPAMYYIQ